MQNYSLILEEVDQSRDNEISSSYHHHILPLSFVHFMLLRVNKVFINNSTF